MAISDATVGVGGRRQQLARLPMARRRPRGGRRSRALAGGIQRAVGTHAVVVTPPGFDQDLGLGQAEEDLAVEQLIAQLAVEALAVAVLPGAAGLDVGGLGADRGNPVAESQGDELRAVV